MLRFFQKGPNKSKVVRATLGQRQPSIEQLETRVVTNEGIIAAHEKTLTFLIATADEQLRRTLAAELKGLVAQGYNQPMPAWVPAKYVQDFKNAACATYMDFIRAAERSFPQSN